MSGDLDLSTTSQGPCAVVTVDGEIDLDNASDLSEAPSRPCRRSVRAVVLDLSGVTFMDSTGLKVLLAVHKTGRARGRPPRARRPDPLGEPGRHDHRLRPDVHVCEVT
jgi:anti-anti-sigma factor